MNNILIVGGDMRNVCLAKEMKKRGVTPNVCGIDKEKLEDFGIYQENLKTAVSKANIIILPLPVTKDGVRIHTPLFDGELFLGDVVKHARKESLICGGKSEGSIFKENALTFYDYAEREDFASLNAVPTAEGAIEAVMKALPITIFSSNVLVTGFGKVSKVLSLTLKAMGAKVRVCARSIRDLSLAEALGLDTAHLDEVHHYLGRADMVFNTIPKRIFFARELDSMKESTPFVDLASAPGGMDADEAKSRGINYMFLPGLPGRYSPVTAAQIILKTITNIIGESGKEENIWICREKE